MVLPLDPAKRRRPSKPKVGQGPAKILSFENFSDGVLLRVIKRQAQWETERLRYDYQLTRGDLACLPTGEQMEEIENGTIEF